MQKPHLKTSITKLVLKLRKQKEVTYFDGPRYTNTDTYIESGRAYKRCTIILTGKGCSIPTCTMCPFTNYNLYNTGKKKPDVALQVQQHLQKIDLGEVEMISIYNDGSFFSNKELSSEERINIVKAVKVANIQVLMVESLPQFITEKKLEEILDVLEGIKLVIGIGLQSATKFVREVCVNTTFSLADYEKAIKMAFRHGIKIKSYVMVKPPFLSEADAYYDVLATAKYLGTFRDYTSITLCPTRVAPNTFVNELFKKGLYTPPDLFTILACLMESIKHIEARVSTLNIVGGDFNSQTASTFDKKYEKVLITALVNFKQTGDVSYLHLRPEIKSIYNIWLEKLRNGRRNDLHKKVEDVLKYFNTVDNGV